MLNNKTLAPLFLGKSDAFGGFTATTAVLNSFDAVAGTNSVSIGNNSFTDCPVLASATDMNAGEVVLVFITEVGPIIAGAVR